MMAIRVASANRTVSNEAVNVVTGIVPIYLMADERAQFDKTKRTELRLIWPFRKQGHKRGRSGRPSGRRPKTVGGHIG